LPVLYSKYCGYFVNPKMFCECCGMQLRASRARRVYKENFGAKKNDLRVQTRLIQRRGECDSIKGKTK
jgi:hypothetical protein